MKKSILDFLFNYYIFSALTWKSGKKLRKIFFEKDYFEIKGLNQNSKSKSKIVSSCIFKFWSSFEILSIWFTSLFRFYTNESENWKQGLKFTLLFLDLFWSYFLWHALFDGILFYNSSVGNLVLSPNVLNVQWKNEFGQAGQ